MSSSKKRVPGKPRKTPFEKEVREATVEGRIQALVKKFGGVAIKQTGYKGIPRPAHHRERLPSVAGSETALREGGPGADAVAQQASEARLPRSGDIRHGRPTLATSGTGNDGELGTGVEREPVERQR